MKTAIIIAMGVLSSSDCQSESSLQLLCYLIIPLEGLEVMVIIYSILVTRVWYHSNLAISKAKTSVSPRSSPLERGETERTPKYFTWGAKA